MIAMCGVAGKPRSKRGNWNLAQQSHIKYVAQEDFAAGHLKIQVRTGKGVKNCNRKAAIKIMAPYDNAPRIIRCPSGGYGGLLSTGHAYAYSHSC
jgi:hypothetical protein